MSLRSRLLLALSAALAMACGSSGPSPVEVDGIYTASGGGVVLTLDVTDHGGDIAGTGTVSYGGANCGLTVTGTRSGLNVTMALSCLTFPNATFVGKEKSATTISGTLSGQGLPSGTVTLIKQ